MLYCLLSRWAKTRHHASVPFAFQIIPSWNFFSKSGITFSFSIHLAGRRLRSKEINLQLGNLKGELEKFHWLEKSIHKIVEVFFGKIVILSFRLRSITERFYIPS